VNVRLYTRHLISADLKALLTDEKLDDCRHKMLRGQSIEAEAVIERTFGEVTNRIKTIAKNLA
jgi:hypothetical protein